MKNCTRIEKLFVFLDKHQKQQACIIKVLITDHKGLFTYPELLSSVGLYLVQYTEIAHCSKVYVFQGPCPNLDDKEKTTPQFLSFLADSVLRPVTVVFCGL